MSSLDSALGELLKHRQHSSYPVAQCLLLHASTKPRQEYLDSITKSA